ncbi:hypothetical protein GOBAR_AA21930 [Gossypium barbadense]|uniref:Uncharacterized protein n=1 Tax=Gossypium barbadense TaxID=3634 RepID=A0A2P5X5X0_GOSBA|nr:hypothetical protein GOBAR_AA21930 [Gossypium barbadense]
MGRFSFDDGQHFRSEKFAWSNGAPKQFGPNYFSDAGRISRPGGGSHLPGPHGASVLRELGYNFRPASATYAHACAPSVGPSHASPAVGRTTGPMILVDCPLVG